MSLAVAPPSAPAVKEPAIRARAAASDAAGTVAESVAVHALFWLVVVCALGLWLSALLLAPRLGALVAPLTYGRWAPLHLDLALYGWLSLPLVGLLFHAYGADRRPRASRLALGLWSGALVAGALSWLAGRSSGKLFLDWSGGAGTIFLVAQFGLALVLAKSWVDTKEGAAGGEPRASSARRVGLRRFVAPGGLVLLLAVPVALAAGASRATYPPIDPSSGGPTGASLLGSTLGLVAIVLLVPRLLRLPVIVERGGTLAPWAFALHGAFFLALGVADRSNALPFEQIAVASTALWAWLLPRELARFLWPAGSRPWIRALLAWGAVVLASGVAQFLPWPLAHVKFTHELVAHAHAAMAGLASALAVLLLHAALVRAGRPSPFDRSAPLLQWQGGTALHVAALAALGALEASDPATLLAGGAAVELLLTLRLVAGAAMLMAALSWFAGLAPSTPLPEGAP